MKLDSVNPFFSVIRTPDWWHFDRSSNAIL